MRLAVVVHAQGDIAEFEFLAMIQRQRRRDDTGAHGRLVGPLFHQRPPQVALHAADFLDRAGMRVDRDAG